MATRFETKVINVKNLTVEEVKEQISYAYNNLEAIYQAKRDSDAPIILSRSGDNVVIKFTRPIVLVPGISSLDGLTVNVKEIGNKQCYVTCQDFPGIKEIHLWLQYLPTENGSILRMVCDTDIAWYNPLGKVIQNILEKNKETIDKEISKVSEQIEVELNEKFAPKEEVAAENA